MTSENLPKIKKIIGKHNASFALAVARRATIIKCTNKAKKNLEVKSFETLEMSEF